jgi:hypothetical protein
MNTTASRKLCKLLSSLIVAQGVLLIVLSRIVSSVNIGPTPFRIGHAGVSVVGILLTLLGFVSLKLSPQASLTILSSFGIMIAICAAGYRPTRRGDINVAVSGPMRVWQSDTEWTEVHTRPDSRLGNAGQPDAVARQINRDFEVTYHMDADGWRRLPSPLPGTAKGEIWFLGCSFTFGAGVEDQEVYVYQLAARAWPEIQVRSFAISGWGTTNAYLALQEQLERRRKPNAVVYGWISHHRMRNYLRKSWFSRSNVFYFPHFELLNGAPHLVGYNTAANAPDGPETDEIEFRLTEALIRAMARLSKQHDIPFVVLSLQNTEDRVLNAVSNEPNLHILDVSRISLATHPNDGHPTRVWHQAVARAVASDPLLSKLTGIPELLKPDAIPDPLWRHWQLLPADRGQGASIYGKIAYPSRPGEPLHAEFSGKVLSEDPWKFSLQRNGYPVLKDHLYSFRVTLRTRTSRMVRYLLSRSAPPWGAIGLEGQQELTSEWQTIRQTFIATEDEPDAHLILTLGGSSEPVDVADEPVIQELSGSEASEALAEAARPHWKLSAPAAAGAYMSNLSADSKPLVRIGIKNADKDIWTVQLQHDGVPLKAGEKYRLEFSVRSEAARPMQYALTQDHAPWDNLGLWGEMKLTTSWQIVSKTFIAKVNDSSTRFIMALGSDAHAVDVSSVRLLHGDEPILSYPER